MFRGWAELSPGRMLYWLEMPGADRFGRESPDLN